MKAYELYIELGKLIEANPADAGKDVYVRHPDRGEHFLKRVQSISDVEQWNEVPEGGVLRSVGKGDGLILG